MKPRIAFACALLLAARLSARHAQQRSSAWRSAWPRSKPIPSSARWPPTNDCRRGRRSTRWPTRAARDRDSALYVAERRVEIAEIAARSQAAQREVDRARPRAQRVAGRGQPPRCRAGARRGRAPARAGADPGRGGRAPAPAGRGRCPGDAGRRGRRWKAWPARRPRSSSAAREKEAALAAPGSRTDGRRQAAASQARCARRGLQPGRRRLRFRAGVADQRGRVERQGACRLRAGRAVGRGADRRPHRQPGQRPTPTSSCRSGVPMRCAMPWSPPACRARRCRPSGAARPSR